MAGDKPLEEKKIPKKEFVPLPEEIPQIIEVVVVSMEKLLFEGMVKSLVVPIRSGEMLAILPGHTPLFTKISAGTITINQENGKPIEIPIASGLAKITQVKATILVDYK